jgi:uncharacterized protein (TIGR02646 family)
MRPVDKGAHPLNGDGSLVVFHAYADAAPYLRERLGRYCSYCERKIPTSLAVEHVIPKSHALALEKVWVNFLLACVNCNSQKGDKVIQLDDCLWPDIDDTFSAFTYEPSGAIKVAVGLDQLQQAKALVLLSLVGLDKTPEQASGADHRYKDRLEQWGKAKVAFDMLQRTSAQSLGKMRNEIITLATDGYSIWATVFRTDPLMLNALVQKYPGTKGGCASA